MNNSYGKVDGLLKKKGYRYGTDATENAAVGYELAMEDMGKNYRADMAELQYWRMQNQDMMHLKNRVDGATHAERIADMRGRP